MYAENAIIGRLTLQDAWEISSRVAYPQLTSDLVNLQSKDKHTAACTPKYGMTGCNCDYQALLSNKTSCTIPTLTASSYTVQSLQCRVPTMAVVVEGRALTTGVL